ncbi:MAG: Ger(x)C family spore germination protein [Ruminiclostridium sp.]|nr:Ger(x)C family spore germination protein [Ruminiclostridium sp.]
MKKLLLPVLAAVLMLSGCTAHAELNELAIAEAIGIDRGGDGYIVTMQYFNTDTTGGTTAIDSSKPNAVTVSGSGSTIESAIESLSYGCGRSVMLGSAGLIVFGREAAYDLMDSLSFAASHYSGNPRAYIAVSETTASDILNVKFSEGNASVEKLEGMMKNAEALGMSSLVMLHEAAEALCCPTESVVLPLLKAVDAGSELTEEGSTVTVTGAALCTGDRLTGTLPPEAVSGLCLLTNEGATCEMTVKLRRKDVCLAVYGTKTKIAPSIEDGALRFDIRLSADCKVVSTQLSDPYGEREAVERIAAAELDSRVLLLLKAVKLHGADISGLSYKIRSYSPELWRSVSGNYREALKNADYSVSCDLHLERFGIMHGSGERPAANPSVTFQ